MTWTTHAPMDTEDISDTDAVGEEEEADHGDESDEWEEEVWTTYVVLDLGTEVTVDSVKAAATEYDGVSLIGLDTPSPYLRVGNLMFKGAFDRTIGTDMIFAASVQDENRPKRPPTGPLPLSTDPNRPDVSMTYLGQSTMKTKFMRVTLEPRTRPSTASDEAEIAGASIQSTPDAS
ncbi:hypothetical protein SpCBS45565_g01296 [Spizellomyces sp. 'palustris']|nr:hypothetical protein SpCBS45565_g01296 [Spizellomyces sp. 'palustris']